MSSSSYGAVYFPPTENLPTFDVLVFRNAQDVTPYATNAGNVNITNTTSGTTYYPTFVDSSSGYENIRTNDPSFTYNANTNTISANTSGSAGVATQVTLSNTASGATNYLVMSATSSGTSSLLTDNSGATYDSTTNTANINITANSGTTSAVAITNTTSGTTYYPTFVDSSSGYEDIRTNNPSYTYNANTNTISANTSGTAANATGVALTLDAISAGAYPIPFSKTTAATGNALYRNTITYTPNTNLLSVGKVSASGLILQRLNSLSMNASISGYGSLTTGDQNTAIGGSVLNDLQTGNDNVGIGHNTQLRNTNSSNNLTIGTNSGYNLNAVGNPYNEFNVCFGGYSGYNGSNMGYTILMGGGAGASIINGTNNTCCGAGADCNNNLSYATAIGSSALCTTSNTVQLGRAVDNVSITGTLNSAKINYYSSNQNVVVGGGSNLLSASNINATGNTILGQNVLSVATTAVDNVAIGTQVLQVATSASTNVGVGTFSLNAITTGKSNVAVGYAAILANVAGDYNTAIGDRALQTFTSGSNNVGIGANSGFFVSGSNNTCIGTNSGTNNALTYATAIGADALCTISNTVQLGRSADNVNISGTMSVTGTATFTNVSLTGDISFSKHSDNMLIGIGGSVNNDYTNINVGNNCIPSAATANGAGSFGASGGNIAIGDGNLRSLTTGWQNIAIGSDVLALNTSSQYNIGIGGFALNYNTTGDVNVGIGANALLQNQTGNQNVAMGNRAMQNVTTGSDFNTCIGSGSGLFTSGNSNTCLGSSSTTGNGLSYATAIGAGAGCTTNDTVQLGRSVDKVNISGTMSVTGVATFTAVPVCTTAATSGSELANKTYVDTAISTAGGAFVTLTGNQTITSGIKTFNVLPECSVAPTTANQLTNYTYVNTKVSLTGNETIAGIKTFSSTVNVVANSITISSGIGDLRISISPLGSASNLMMGINVPYTTIFTSGGANTIYGNYYTTPSIAVTASSNTLIGSNSGVGLTSGSNNVFLGATTGFQVANGTGSQNTCVGSLSGDSLSGVGSQNTLVGYNSGSSLTTGSNNTCIGFNAGSTVTGDTNIIIGSSATPPTVGNSNQIAIGTANETMYIRGGFNWRVGTQITSTATGNLATAVLAQFYTVAMSAAAQTIALPNPAAAAYLGARVTFKRKTNTTVFTITSTGGAGFVPIGSITLTASPISIAATVFQVDLVCDGTNWCIIGQA